MPKKEIFTTEDVERIQNTFEKIVRRYRVALADSIKCPANTIPDSAISLVSEVDLQMAETRRNLFQSNEIELKLNHHPV